MFGSLSPHGLIVSEVKDGPPILSVSFAHDMDQDARRRWAKMTLRAPEMLSLLEKLDTDLAEIISFAAMERGGPVTGLAAVQADPDFARVITRQAELQRLLALVKG